MNLALNACGQKCGRRNSLTPPQWLGCQKRVAYANRSRPFYKQALTLYNFQLISTVGEKKAIWPCKTNYSPNSNSTKTLGAIFTGKRANNINPKYVPTSSNIFKNFQLEQGRQQIDKKSIETSWSSAQYYTIAKQFKLLYPYYAIP